MTDGLGDLRTRVEAARERLVSDVAMAQKVELRLNDLARIVEGSLARQGAELETARQRLASVEADLARAELRAAQASGEASRAEGLAHENGELRSMVMALLEVVEGRQKSSLASVMQHLEESVSALLAPAGGAWTADIKDGAGNNEIATETILMPDPSGTEATGMEGEPDAEPGPEKHGGFEIDADVMVDEEPAAGMDPDGSVVVEPGDG